ncbi:hypothetical protein TPL01_01700 [Sulfuriferula plumbiphila]|uniref:Zinc finger/thioredoxin putative domain-containing protein n=1 Tax=Sulfuriferula plumbiphila TaxID=171865 RepID=A0A512L3L0_9PROT|nr:DUF3426 domain-containing protein [Sulfuriferula plumbiphila]BBP02738.1 hypothetical protein SFPGR_01600 [Sulfuriferula plumbiphila]GEP29032.1 hypothetical protein TPL01_01700 [Sulfuriferula plumbiphila]
MSLLTTCPHCHTVFRVTAELLAARDGQVRCGICSSVFDARAHLTPEADQVGQTGMPHDAAVEPDTSSVEEFTAAAEEPLQAADISAPEAVAPASLAEEIAAPAEESSVEESVVEPITEPAIAETESAHPPPAPTSPTGATALARRKRIRTLLLGTGSALLGLLLAVQLVYFLRTPIAARIPAVKPWLVAACSALDCSVPLPRDADAIKISSSDLLSDPAHPARIQVSLLIANEAGYAEAYPHIELTLTDTHDAPLARRIFAPAEYLKVPAKAAAGIRPGSEASVDLLLDIGNLPATGYRVLVFYP